MARAGQFVESSARSGTASRHPEIAWPAARGEMHPAPVAQSASWAGSRRNFISSYRVIPTLREPCACESRCELVHTPKLFFGCGPVSALTGKGSDIDQIRACGDLHLDIGIGLAERGDQRQQMPHHGPR